MTSDEINRLFTSVMAQVSEHGISAFASWMGNAGRNQLAGIR